MREWRELLCRLVMSPLSLVTTSVCYLCLRFSFFLLGVVYLFFPFSSAACCLGPLDSLLSLQQQQQNVTSQSSSKRTSAADKNPKRAEILPLKVS